MKIKQFPNRLVDLGVIKSGTIYRVEFPYVGVKQVLKWEVSCDCLEVVDDKVGKMLVVKWKANKVPPQMIMRKQYHYKAEKSVTVTFFPTVGSESIVGLMIKAIVQDKL